MKLTSYVLNHQTALLYLLTRIIAFRLNWTEVMLVKGHHEVVLELVKLIAAIKVSARLATVHGVGTPWRMQVKIILQ